MTTADASDEFLSSDIEENLERSSEDEDQEDNGDEIKFQYQRESDNPDDLWGELPALDAILAPRRLLIEQAQLLSDRTQHVLVGSVKSYSNTLNHLVTDLSIVAPLLNNYQVTILRVRHPPAPIYPATVVDILNDPSKSGEICNDSYELTEMIKDVLRSTSVRAVISSLLVQSVN